MADILRPIPPRPTAPPESFWLPVAESRPRTVVPPAIFVVGEVVRLRDGLDWLGALDGRQLNADPLGTRRRNDAG